MLHLFTDSILYIYSMELLAVGGLVSIKTKFDRKVSGKSGTSRLNFAIEEHWFDMRSKSYIHI